jgi:pseudaminic acid biosynthesis-associated methylase
MSKQVKKLWKGDFGDEYQKRNPASAAELLARRVLWAWAIDTMHPPGRTGDVKSYLEVGAGAGSNLLSIHDLYKDSGKDVDLLAVEPNLGAAKLLRSLDRKIKVINKPWQDVEVTEALADVVFTSGVLIHVHPSEVKAFMEKIAKAAKKYVLLAEYFSPEVREVPYRGQSQALWTADYGGMFMDNHPLRCVDVSFWWRRTTGLDNLTVWIFQKVH